MRTLRRSHVVITLIFAVVLAAPLRGADTPARKQFTYDQVFGVPGGLRLTHGTIDDNVHMQNTIRVVYWMVSHNKPFELMLYPDSRHGTQASQRAHATRESHDFWMRNLLGRAPQGER